MNLKSVAAMPDCELLVRVKCLARRERQVTAALVAHLAEVEYRNLHLAEGYPSLFSYCTQVLHLSEHAAYVRIEAARAVRRFPLVLECLECGDLHLTAVRMLSPLLTPANHRRLLAAARHKSKREIELLVAQLRPKPPVPDLVRRLPAATPDVATLPGAQADTTAGVLRESTGRSTAGNREGACPPGVSNCEHSAPGDGASSGPAGLANEKPIVPCTVPTRPAVIVPLTPERYKVQFTASVATCNKLRRAQDLLRHRIPSGDLAAVFDEALDVLLRDLERRKFAATRSPGTNFGRRDGLQNRADATRRTNLHPRADTQPEAQAGRSADALTAVHRDTGGNPAPTAVVTDKITRESGQTGARAALDANVSASVGAGGGRGSRHIPADVKRTVWQRDEGRCAYVGSNGIRCTERGRIEFDHIIPHADGGDATAENVRLLCRQHNQFQARQYFGVWRAEGAEESRLE